MIFFRFQRIPGKGNQVDVEVFDIESSSAKKYEKTSLSGLYSNSGTLRSESTSSMFRMMGSPFRSRSNSAVGSLNFEAPSDLNYITENLNLIHLTRLNSFLINIHSAKGNRINNVSTSSNILPDIES
jgi:hypothetical protein